MGRAEDRDDLVCHGKTGMLYQGGSVITIRTDDVGREPVVNAFCAGGSVGSCPTALHHEQPLQTHLHGTERSWCPMIRAKLRTFKCRARTSNDCE